MVDTLQNIFYFHISSLPLFLFSEAVVQIQKLERQVFEFVPLLDENGQEKFFTFFGGGAKVIIGGREVREKWTRTNNVKQTAIDQLQQISENLHNSLLF